MQTMVADSPNQLTPSGPKGVTAATAQYAAQQYLDAHFVDFEPVKPFFLANEDVWRFIIRSPLWPVGYIKVDAQSGEPLPLTIEERRILQEKADIAEAEQRGELPIDNQGYIVREYAKTQARVYLGDQLSIYFGAEGGQFISGAPPLWQFTMTFRHSRYGEIDVSNLIGVDAQTGNVIPLNDQILQQIQERVHAVIRHRKQTTTP